MLFSNSAKVLGIYGGTNLLAVGVGLAEGVLIGTGVGSKDGVKDGEGVGFGVAIAIPLFHTSFLPLLMHIYFFPA